MKVQKVSIAIMVEVLSIDSVYAMVEKAMQAIRSEYENGELQANDGDSISWTVTRDNVEF